MRIPESLERRIEMFRTAAHAHVDDPFSLRGSDAIFRETRWISVMLGQNIVPRGYHPFVAGLQDAGPFARVPRRFAQGDPGGRGGHAHPR